MRRSGFSGLALSSAVALAMCGTIGLAQQPKDGAAERAGARLDDAARSLRKGLQQAREAVRSGFAEIRDDVHGMGIEARVYGRIHWDKALTDANIEVAVEEGVATLTGSVPNAAAKTRAETLARETVGVTRVVDQLSVAAPGTPSGTTTTTTTTKTTTRP